MRPNRSTHSTPPPFRRREIVEDDSPHPFAGVASSIWAHLSPPLKELYPDEEEDSSNTSSSKGIDSWLSVWSNGFLLENIDENRKKVTRFFPIESLHYCAAVRYVLESKARFLPLDSPFAKNPYNNHPPLFAAILRRTSGIKVLECHVFICKKETAANALLEEGGGGGVVVNLILLILLIMKYDEKKKKEWNRVTIIIIIILTGCFSLLFSLTDSLLHLCKNLENGGPTSLYGTLGPSHSSRDVSREYQQSVIEVSEDSINSIEKVEEWKVNGNSSQQQIIASVSPKKSPLNQN
ncbi:CG12581 CG12581PAlike, partial [Caligus rogercresseyi]